MLVTGGAGYIGSQTAKALVQEGYQPVLLDNLSSGHRWAARGGRLVEGDLADVDLVRRTLVEQKATAVIHFAASIQVGESVANPRKYFWNNVVNTLKLLDAMQDAEVKHIVFSSSAAVYGTPETTPIPEEHPQRPINPYGESKLMMERALKWYGDAYGLRWMALRYFNACGADLGSEVGEDHNPETHLIPLVIQAALGRRPFVEVYGNDYPTPDGTAVRDYIHVVDLAEAHVRALRHIFQGGESAALNLGTGQGLSVREVIAAVDRVVAAAQRQGLAIHHDRVPVRDGPRRAGDPPFLVADSRHARRVLGWAPQRSDLDTIVQSAWNWHLKHRW
ncbi:MAG TPA: UDP-glucose 4-epimerase GalE [Terriglobia bacterium]|nr:UDP-glucose 4-epimerase GalE [Terriglobia bacterium]